MRYTFLIRLPYDIYCRFGFLNVVEPLMKNHLLPSTQNHMAEEVAVDERVYSTNNLPKAVLY